MIRSLMVLSAVAMSVVLSAPVYAGAFVAGLQPDRRPAGAPNITTFVLTPEMKAVRLTGISLPLPGNVEVIAQQGAWYSPMFRPGMTGPYDLRRWHGSRE